MKSVKARSQQDSKTKIYGHLKGLARIEHFGQGNIVNASQLPSHCRKSVKMEEISLNKENTNYGDTLIDFMKENWCTTGHLRMTDTGAEFGETHSRWVLNE